MDDTHETLDVETVEAYNAHPILSPELSFNWNEKLEAYARTSKFSQIMGCPLVGFSTNGSVDPLLGSKQLFGGRSTGNAELL